MELDIAQGLAMLLSGGSAAGFAGLAGAQRLGYFLGKNGEANGCSKEMTKVVTTLDSMVRTLEPLAGILSAMRAELGIISERQVSAGKIPVMDQKINDIQNALTRIENDLETFRPRARAAGQNQR
jgi:hypothetical protein